MCVSTDSYIKSVMDSFETSYCVSDKVRFKESTRQICAAILTYFLVHPESRLTHEEILRTLLCGEANRYILQQYLARLVHAGILDRAKVAKVTSDGKVTRPVYGYTGSHLFLNREDPGNFQYLQFKKQYRYTKRIS